MIYPATVMLMVMGILVLWNVATKQESECQAAQVASAIYACDAGTALLYPNGPHSTPLGRLYTSEEAVR